MNDISKKRLSNAMSIIGILLFSVTIVVEICTNYLDKWTGFLASSVAMVLILGSQLVNKWGSDIGKTDKILIIITASLLAVSVILTLISRPETFLFGFAQGTLLVGLITYLIVWYRTNF